MVSHVAAGSGVAGRVPVAFLPASLRGADGFPLVHIKVFP